MLLVVDPRGSHGGDPDDTSIQRVEEGDGAGALYLAFLSRALALPLVPMALEPPAAPLPDRLGG